MQALIILSKMQRVKWRDMTEYEENYSRGATKQSDKVTLF